MGAGGRPGPTARCCECEQGPLCAKLMGKSRSGLQGALKWGHQHRVGGTAGCCKSTAPTRDHPSCPEAHLLQAPEERTWGSRASSRRTGMGTWGSGPPVGLVSASVPRARRRMEDRANLPPAGQPAGQRAVPTGLLHTWSPRAAAARRVPSGVGLLGIRLTRESPRLPRAPAETEQSRQDRCMSRPAFSVHARAREPRLVLNTAKESHHRRMNLLPVVGRTSDSSRGWPGLGLHSGDTWGPHDERCAASGVARSRDACGGGSVQEGSGRRHIGCQGPGAATGEPGRSSETQLGSIQV